ncbi:MAG: GspH/FimT family pseudopilin [Woeseiaceae bacterium]|nr:GspH/FimT family pseudopilin [Woeseiaceae bacterium]
MSNSRQRGFTIYELLITMLIIGIILTIGVPSMTSFSRNSRITGTANDLHSSFQLARSEAARSKTNITICASANSMDADANCSGTFDDGWIIFFDLNGDIDRAGPDENIIRSHPAPSDLLDITTNAGATYFSYAPSGLGRGDVGGDPAVQTAIICDERGNVVAAGGSSAARVLVVTPIGRATVLRDVTQIASHGGCP